MTLKRIVLRDYYFVRVLQEVVGTLQNQQYLNVFYCPSLGIVEPVTQYVSPDFFGRQIKAWVIPSTKKVIFKTHVNDVLELYEDELDVVSNLKSISELADEVKLHIASKAVGSALISALSIFGILIVVILKLLKVLKSWKFIIPFVVLLLLSLFVTSSIIDTVNQTVVYDRIGNWVDTETGKYSLKRKR